MGTVTSILVVDDEEMYLDLLSEVLQMYDYQVRTTMSPQEAKRIFLDFKPDLLVSDWLLKDDMTGHDLAQELHDLRPDLKVVIVSGLPNIKIDKGDWIQVLKKPFRQAELLDVIRSFGSD